MNPLLLFFLCIIPASGFGARRAPLISGQESTSRLFVFGLGYVGARLAREMDESPGWAVAGTVTSLSSTSSIPPSVRVFEFDACPAAPKLLDPQGLCFLRRATHVLISIPPMDGHDPVVDLYRSELLKNCACLRWLGYLSSTSVYGDRQGAWVTEDDEVRPVTSKALARVRAEQAWMELRQCMLDRPLLCRVFRLAGIYGPDRNALTTLRKGMSGAQGGGSLPNLDGDSFVSRIHVEDIIRILRCSMDETVENGTEVEIYNVADNRPASRLEVFSFAASLLGDESILSNYYHAPSASTNAHHFPSTSPRALSRRARRPESKRVSNKKMRKLLSESKAALASLNLRHPTFTEGLSSILKDEKADIEQRNLEDNS